MHLTHHLSGPDWGSIPEWVSAIATVLALCGAGVTIWFAARAVRISREANNITLATYQADLKDRRERQARFVYALNDVPQTHHAGEVIQRFPPNLTGAAETGVFVDGSFRILNGGKTEQTVAADMLSTMVTVHNRSEEIVASWMVSLYDRFTGAPVGGIGVGDQAPPCYPVRPELCISTCLFTRVTTPTSVRSSSFVTRAVVYGVDVAPNLSSW